MASFPFTLADFLGGDFIFSGLDHVTDGVERAKTRMLQQYKELPNIEAFTTIYAARLQEVEDALWDAYTLRILDSATGLQLDTLGKILVLSRGSLVDSDYRSALRAQVSLLRSSGTIEDLYLLVTLLLYNAETPSEAVLEITEVYPAGFTLTVSGEAITKSVLIVSFIRRGRMGGVRAIVEYTPAGDSDTFKWDTAGQGWDDGTWADALES